jgi:alkyl sulfatase BDS1-like metallo-beta-lactamase superfamily hydrolase
MSHVKISLSRFLSGLVALLILISTPAFAQEPGQQEKAKEEVPANPRLVRHTNFFTPKRVYDLQLDPYSKPHVPGGLNYQTYTAVGYDLANSIMIVGPDKGIIIVDTLGDEQSAVEVAKLFRQRLNLPENSPLPIKAIIYTHNHIDHTAGVQGYLKNADRKPCLPETEKNQGMDGTYIANGNCVEIIGQKNIVDSVINTATVVGNIINPRSVYMYGNLIPQADRTNNGIGPFISPGTPTFQMPSRTFTNELKFAAAGVNMKIIYVPSETDDELAVFLPDNMNQRDGGVAREDGWGGKGLLLSAEVIQGPSYPNLYSLRGTSYRNPATWFRSVDKLRELDSWCMVPSHGPPLCGADNIQLLLKNFRDAIQFTHDQTVRYTNMGDTPPEMAAHIKLPDYLVTDLRQVQPPGVKGLPQTGAIDAADYRNPEDYLTPFYGSVPQAVREIYFGYVGWFEADPVGLSPTPPKELAEKTVQMMGKDKMMTAAQEALDKGTEALNKGEAFMAKGQKELARAEFDKAQANSQWAAELMTLVIRVNHDDRDARKIKGAAFRNLAVMVTNPNWRDWYISSSMELKLPDGVHFPAITGALVSPEIVSALPAGAWVNSWTMRLKAEDSMKREKTLTMGFWFPPDQNYGGEGFSIKIRKAIAEFVETNSREPTGPDVDVAISMTRDALAKLLRAEADAIGKKNEKIFIDILKEAIKNGQVQLIKGTELQLAEFFSYFDPRMTTMPYLTIR